MTNPTPHGQVPEALRLAALLDADEWPGSMSLVSYARACVAELLRLHAENQVLRTTHVQSPTENEHVAGDVWKNGVKLNMSTQQKAAEASRFGSPELQAMIVARCVAKDQADSVREDAARYRMVRRGQRWSVVDGIGNDLRAEALDSAIDAIRVSHGQAPAHVLHLVQDAFAEVAMAYPKAFALHKVGLADTAVRKALATTTAQAAPAYKDSTPELHIGDSAFESWYSTYSPVHKSDKQRARDAYAAGMGDPLVTAAPTTQPSPQQEAQEPVAVVVPCYTPSGKRVALYSAKQDLPIGTQLYAAPQPSPQQGTSPTAGMSIAQRILHVGGRNNAAGYVEFGSTQAVEALVKHVLRDLQPSPAAQGDALDAARYRWLRDKNNPLEQFDYGRMHPNGTSCYHMVGGVRELKSGEELDCAIDAARAAQEGK